MNYGTGENEANTVYLFVRSVKLTEKVQALRFDTTPVNTGRHNGVCKHLEDKLGHELLWLACRHHMIELVLAKVFLSVLGQAILLLFLCLRNSKLSGMRLTHITYHTYLQTHRQLISNNPQLLSFKEMIFYKCSLEMTTRSSLN